MASLGNVTRSPETGAFKGNLRTLHVRCDIEIVPVPDKASPNHPDYRVLSGGVDLGGGWLNIGEVSGREYIGLTLAHPDLGPRALKLKLGRAAGQDDDDVFALIWNAED